MHGGLQVRGDRRVSLYQFVAVAAGGAVGAVLRYMISLIPLKGDFPFATLLINLLGAVAIGFISGIAPPDSTGRNWLLFCKTGMCGGFTTFSTFSLECFQLFESGKHTAGIVYMILSTAGCLLGVRLGIFLGRIAAK